MTSFYFCKKKLGKKFKYRKDFIQGGFLFLFPFAFFVLLRFVLAGPSGVKIGVLWVGQESGSNRRKKRETIKRLIERTKIQIGANWEMKNLQQNHPKKGVAINILGSWVAR